MERETLEKEEVAEIFTNVKAWPARKPWTGSKDRKPSKQPPVVFEKSEKPKNG
jgi:cell division protease FtsH